MGDGLMFRQAFFCEEMNGLYWTDSYNVWRWEEAPVYVSMTRQGDALVCHFSALPSALRQLRKAIKDFCRLAPEVFPWCKMFIGCIKRESVVRLMKDCGFWHVVDREHVKIYARYT